MTSYDHTRANPDQARKASEPDYAALLESVDPNVVRDLLERELSS